MSDTVAVAGLRWAYRVSARPVSAIEGRHQRSFEAGKPVEGSGRGRVRRRVGRWSGTQEKMEKPNIAPLFVRGDAVRHQRQMKRG